MHAGERMMKQMSNAHIRQQFLKSISDGSWSKESEVHLKALTEFGRQRLSTRTINYDATLTKLEVIEAKTRNENGEIIIPKEKIEDKPLASDPRILKEDHQVLIPFEGITI
jgi:hypothetical protein